MNQFKHNASEVLHFLLSMKHKGRILLFLHVKPDILIFLAKMPRLFHF